MHRHEYSRQHQRRRHIANQRQHTFKRSFGLNCLELPLTFPVDLAKEVFFLGIGLDVLNYTQHLFRCVDSVVLRLEDSFIVNYYILSESKCG
jgi:hypothetical protein